jgi:hypothetical protein
MKTLITSLKNIISGNYNRYFLGGAVGLFAVYSFFIASTVVAINQRKDLRQEIRASQGQVSELEIKYFNLSAGIDIKKASELGFVDSQTPIFAYAKATEEKVALVR